MVVSLLLLPFLALPLPGSLMLLLIMAALFRFTPSLLFLPLFLLPLPTTPWMLLLVPVFIMAFRYFSASARSQGHPNFVFILIWFIKKKKRRVADIVYVRYVIYIVSLETRSLARIVHFFPLILLIKYIRGLSLGLGLKVNSKIICYNLPSSFSISSITCIFFWTSSFHWGVI